MSTPPPRSILHVDMDAFYASVEVLDDPTLAGRPVLVGGSPRARGVVAAASYEARRFGVHSAMSMARALRLCPQAVVRPPRMARYAELSRSIRAILLEYTPLVEPLSIDEAFLDVTGSRALHGEAVAIARRIQARIRDELGLGASIGVAPNKFLAKLASDLEKPRGFVVVPADSAREFIAPLPVSKLWGVGPATQRALEAMGLRTIGDVARTPLDVLERRFGSHARRLWDLAHGRDDRPVTPEREPRSMSAERTFAEDVADAAALREAVDALADSVARRLRRGGWRAGRVVLKARYADFTTVTRTQTLPEPACDTPTVRDAARELLERRLDRRGRALRLLGVGVGALVRASDVAPGLFRDERVARTEAIDRAVDALRERFGSGAISLGRPPKRR